MKQYRSLTFSYGRDDTSKTANITCCFVTIEKKTQMQPCIMSHMPKCQALHT